MNDLQRELRNLKAHPQFIVCMPCHEIAKNIEGYMDFLVSSSNSPANLS